MLNVITKFFAAPEDKDPTFIRLTRNILIFTLVATFLLIIVVVASPNTRGSVATMVALAVLSVVEVPALLLVLRGNVGVAKFVIPIALIFAVTINAANGNSIHDISIVAYPLIIIIATLLQERRSLVIAVPLTLGAVVLLSVLDMTGFNTNPLSSKTDIADIIVVSVILLTATGILNLLVGRLKRAVSNAKANEQSQIEANQELKKLQASLEQRVQERTSELTLRGLEVMSVNKQIQRRAMQLEAVAQVMQTITSVRDLQQLLPHIAAVISERFGFYHVGVFLLDEVHEYAVLSATNSEGGRKMLERKHRLRVAEEGIVGYVASTGEPRIALDVGADAVYFNNPDLPETRSETALPMKARNETIGVLDIQSLQANAFSTEDLQTLTALANQVSIALENARLLTETRAALTQVQEVYNAFTHAEWSRTIAKTEQPGFRYQTGRIEMLENEIETPEVMSAAQSGEVATNQTNGSRDRRATVAVPVKLRGEVIGILHVEANDPFKQWQDDEISLVQAVAERAAFAMENARLFQEARRRAAKERLISEATARISGAFNIENILQTTAEELERVLGGSEISIQFEGKEQS